MILAEKPDFATTLAAVIGGCYIDGVELTPDMLTSKKYEGKIKSKRFKDGFLKARLDGKECVVTWVFGHLAELKQAYDYDPKYRVWKEDIFPFIPNEYEIKLKEESGIKNSLSL